MYKQIENYAAQWNVATNNGRLIMQYAGGYKSLPVGDAAELAALTTLVREEKPVFVHMKTGLISTSWEPTGEGEE